MDALISVVITLVILGLVLWVIETLLPLDATIKMVIRVVIILAVIIWLLRALGVWSGHFAF